MPAYLLLGCAVMAAPCQLTAQGAIAPVASARPALINSAPQLGNSINGHIFDTSRRPIAQIYVELMNDVYQPIARTRTDGSGRFNFSNLSSGRFKIKVLVTGTEFIEQTQDIEINNFGRNGPGGTIFSRESREVDFYLKTRVEANGSGLLGSPGVVFVQDVPKNAQKLYEQAISDLESGKRVQQGLDGLKHAIEAFPNYFMALDRLGTEYITIAGGHEELEAARAASEYGAAAILLNKAVEVNPKSYQSLQMLGTALWKINNTEAAVAAFNRALVLAPSSINTLVALGTVLQQQGKYAEAEANLKKANELGKGRIPEVHYQLARVYNHTKRNLEAANELEIFLKLKPDARDAEKIRQFIIQLREKGNTSSASSKG